MMDFTKLRAQAMQAGEDEEAVTVNTRALIDKVLARYSGEHTTLRELLQNAADANASTVKIKFETLPSAQVPLSNTTNQSEVLKHVLLHHSLRRLLVTNDGTPFGSNDWSRLKRIAEGNPDETKIGAFGVGFYSVFADCEEPFVSSGSEAMAFYWKGNSLFTRKLQLPEKSPDTSFVLDYRNSTSPIPNLLVLCQFLATSLTFVALQNIELWVDDWKIISLQKKAAPSVNYPIPKDVETKTKEGLMKVCCLERESVQMDAIFMNVVGWRPSSSTIIPKSSAFGENIYGNGSEAPSLRSFFSRLTTAQSHTNLKSKTRLEEKAMHDIILEDLTAVTRSHVFLSVTTGTIRTAVPAAFSSELERATKKPPPKSTKLAILTSSYDEAVASESLTKSETVARGIDVFASVLPGKRPGGRVFIGFPTHQTTGAGMHLSAPSVIPTVERESIDLNARWVRTWNVEMLRAAGIISRLAFSKEMSDLSTKLRALAGVAGRGSKILKKDVDELMPEALHILQTFTFSESTPSSQVSQIIEEAFWTTYKKASIEVYSTRGVQSTTSVRMATEDLSGFVEGIPVIPDTIASHKFIRKLIDFGLITEITVDDVKKELGAKALTKEQLVQFIGWAGKKAATGALSASTVQDLLDSAVAMVGESENQGDIVALSSIKHFRNVKLIPPELPVPANTLSWELTKLSNPVELQALGWEPLEIVPWIRFLVESIGCRNGLTSEQDITWSPTFAGQVLAVLSKQWDPLSQSSKGTLIVLLRPLSIIPTKFGMKVPTEAYFSSVKLFDDLPIVSVNNVKDKLLVALGVRKTVELDTIFQRLLNPSEPDGQNGGPKWSHVDLITYLTSVRNDIPAEDLEKLKNTPICPAEAGPRGMEASQATTKRYKISELFEPKDSLRHLDFPTLQWYSNKGRATYSPGSQEGRFLQSLGLRACPSVPEIVNLMASDDFTMRSRARTYFITNYDLHRYSSFELSGSTKPFLPIAGDEKRLVTPSECFTNEKSRLLGFNVLSTELSIHASKFAVAENPPMTECVKRLIEKPPQSRRDAISLFGYFATRLGEIGQNHVARLGDARIVPVGVASKTQSPLTEKQSKTRELRHVTPQMCFIGDSPTYKDIFDFVNFSNEANTFLLHCGSRHEPSKAQVASMLANEPARVLGVVQSPEKYLSLLRTLAESLYDLKKDKNLFNQMKISPFLLAIRQIPGQSSKKNGAEEDNFDSVDLEDDDEDTTVMQYTLQSATRIVIDDDYSTFRLFKEGLLCAPLEENLEMFYIALGSSRISGLVHDEVRVSPEIDDRGLSAKLQKTIVERSRLFLHDYPAHEVKHNSKWLEKNLSVRMVANISLKKSLRGYSFSHTSRQTATLNHHQQKGWVLWITPKYDNYHISQALVAKLLVRPTNQATTLLEFVLNSKLQTLKHRGYNVDRILRAQAADARIAEDERRKQLEAEQKQIQQEEDMFKQNQAALDPIAVRDERQKSNQVAMPGAFGDDDVDSPLQEKKPRGLLSSIRNRLGLNGVDDAQQQLQTFLGGHSGQGGSQNSEPAPPPSYDELTKQIGGNHGGRRPGQTETVTSPHSVHQNLVNAIKASRSHDSTALYSAPQTNIVKEEATYCDQTPAQNITQVGETRNLMRIFVSKDLTVTPAAFLRENAQGINFFAVLLQDICEIYSLPRTAMHIFFDESGGTIAFNSQGSIFCNYRFFQQLHMKNMESSSTEARTEAASWWWVVVAHELAHNLVATHSAEHSYYTEMFIAQYFSKMMARGISYGQAVPVQLQNSRAIEGAPKLPVSTRLPQRSLLDE